MLLMALLAASSAQCLVPPTEAARQMSLSYEQFDTLTGPSGWRQINGAGCTDDAVALLKRYLDRNSSRLRPDQRSETLFHIAQAYAYAGRSGDALPYVLKARELGGTKEWTTYLDANRAFLSKDRAALRKARALYERIAPKSDRLAFIDGFLACPDKDYMAAAMCKR